MRSHVEGAYRVAEAFGLAFLPLAVTRCDRVIPEDMLAAPAVEALLNALCSARLRKELGALAGYDSASTGRMVARTKAPS